METKNDYYKEILGLSLTGPKVALETTVQITERSQYLFYCSSEDFEENKEFVCKILKASQQNDGIVITSLADVKKLNPLEVFSFGEAVELMGIKVHSFPSFSEISSSPKDKAQLWAELKKRM